MTDTEEIKRVFDEQKDLRLNSLDIISSFENLNNWGKIKKKPTEWVHKQDFLPPEDTMFYDERGRKNLYV